MKLKFWLQLQIMLSLEGFCILSSNLCWVDIRCCRNIVADLSIDLFQLGQENNPNARLHFCLDSSRNRRKQFLVEKIQVKVVGTYWQVILKYRKTQRETWARILHPKVTKLFVLALVVKKFFCRIADKLLNIQRQRSSPKMVQIARM